MSTFTSHGHGQLSSLPRLCHCLINRTSKTVSAAIPAGEKTHDIRKTGKDTAEEFKSNVEERKIDKLKNSEISLQLSDEKSSHKNRREMSDRTDSNSVQEVQSSTKSNRNVSMSYQNKKLDNRFSIQNRSNIKSHQNVPIADKKGIKKGNDSQRINIEQQSESKTTIPSSQNVPTNKIKKPQTSRKPNKNLNQGKVAPISSLFKTVSRKTDVDSTRSFSPTKVSETPLFSNVHTASSFGDNDNNNDNNNNGGVQPSTSVGQLHKKSSVNNFNSATNNVPIASTSKQSKFNSSKSVINHDKHSCNSPSASTFRANKGNASVRTLNHSEGHGPMVSTSNNVPIASTYSNVPIASTSMTNRTNSSSNGLGNTSVVTSWDQSSATNKGSNSVQGTDRRSCKVKVGQSAPSVEDTRSRSWEGSKEEVMKACPMCQTNFSAG